MPRKDKRTAYGDPLAKLELIDIDTTTGSTNQPVQLSLTNIEEDEA